MYKNFVRITTVKDKDRNRLEGYKSGFRLTPLRKISRRSGATDSRRKLSYWER